MNPDLDLCQVFAKHVAETRFEDLSNEAVDAAKKSILDIIGVTLAGSGMEPAVRGVADVVLDAGGRQEASVLGFGGKIPAQSAAFANGVMAHCLDFDDQTPWGAHPDSTVVPAVLALAERKGKVSGRDLITSVALGQDLFVRLRCNVGWRQDWNLSSVVGAFAGAAAAAYIHGLSREQIAHALGIASMQSSGTMQVIFGIGSDLRGMYAGFTAQGAVMSVLLAQRGITGIAELFEGKAGIFNVYFSGKYEREKMIERLGKEYLGGSMLYKAWPAVGNVHTYIHATIELMKEHGLKPGDIEQIKVFVGDFHQRMCYPLELRRAPATLVDAKFSLPFCVALAAARGQIRISDFSAAALLDPEVLGIAEKVIPIEDSSLDWKVKIPDGRMEIVTRDGGSFARLGDNVPGSSEAPMSWESIEQKFRDCAAVAANPLTVEKTDCAIQLARDLESLEDATAFLNAVN
ncbi:MmgE/PrpD family protein [Paraburkholderia phymatum]|uniref:MmgE/PrpD family protein n=1 Tax=Paraburkholderia phymatum (strain DSM 17167 / CIP 108236 / LMG 21445 / STM815) TaxID=391038 RepID=B2JTC4_PARP8|nr:MmgE/PrpD family protein [Paraburkholderia phymatum]ACC75827.1 MmgE/PrpD family protein [Paraburkholderia phymatum STM815]